VWTARPSWCCLTKASKPPLSPLNLMRVQLPSMPFRTGNSAQLFIRFVPPFIHCMRHLFLKLRSQEVRRIFENRIETTTDGDGIITAQPTKSGSRSRHFSRPSGRGRGPRGKGANTANKSFKDLGGEYLHFTLYKESKDTMEAINMIARKLRIPASEFNFFGTKDRRAATTQRISVKHQREHNLTFMNSLFPTVKMGGFIHSQEPILLGQHGGNEFILTLKNCEPLVPDAQLLSVAQRMKIIQSSVESALSSLHKQGYLNYFGLQRFGTFDIGTHILGKKILQNDFEGAIDDILHVDKNSIECILAHEAPESKGPLTDDNFARARAIHNWKTTGNSRTSLDILPKRFSTETSIIRHLGNSPKDFMGAVLSITRGMRTMYIHAYQSYVWNFVASKRWSQYGSTVIVGDLVLLNNGRLSAQTDSSDMESPGEGSFYAQAHALTQEDIASSRYSIFDIVLPTPGFDVIYPQNDIGDYYVTFMKDHGGLSPYDMRRKKKEFSLSGSYRYLIGRFLAEPAYAIRLYDDDTEQMYPTDLDIINMNKRKSISAQPGQLLTQSLGARPARGARPPAAVSPHWASFTSNTEIFDQAMDDNRRRKAAEALSDDSVFTRKDIWVQTGLDDSDKRIKLNRQNQTVMTTASEVTGAEGPKGGLSAVTPVSTVQLAPADLADPLNWYGGSMPEAPPAGCKDTVGEGENTIKEIEVPVFCKPSDDPFVSKNDLSHELNRRPGAKKVAIILKFQLGTSNYATVVLRELMSSNAEDTGHQG